jgi:cobyrinic acid a,c-diamide synthase
VIARIVIAGTSSGAGKTTVATGLLAALAARGMRPAGFKVGPDFIDPSYHALASGRPGRNLDAFLSGPELIGPLFRHGSAGADVAVVEGVMGLYDGASGRGELASTAHVAKLLRAPVVLVLDAAALARSAAAIVHGYASFDPEVGVAGVILNRVGSEGHAQLLREAIEPLGVPVLGVLRRDDALAAPERHLGLVPVAEREARALEALGRLGAAIEAGCDLDALLRLARAAPDEPGQPWRPAPGTDPVPARIAVARGPAFSFHYEENLELLRAAGAELVDLDPLADEALPPRTGALVLAGGFPEAYGEELSANWALRAEIAAFAARGRPVLAECGGLLYLARELDGRPMCDVIPAAGHMTDRLTLGYREAVALAGHPAWPSGTAVRGHEFHYSRVEPDADPEAPAWALRARGVERREGHVAGGVHASYLHTHWAATPAVAARLVAAAAAGARRPRAQADLERPETDRSLQSAGPGAPRR